MADNNKHLGRGEMPLRLVETERVAAPTQAPEPTPAPKLVPESVTAPEPETPAGDAEHE